MPTNPSIWRLDTGDATLVFDLARGYAELAWLGARLPADEDCEALCALGRRGAHESEPDRRVPPSILPLGQTGYPGLPVVETCRQGRLLPLAPGGTQCIAQSAALCFSERNEHVGLRIESRWRALGGGLVAVELDVINESATAVQLQRCASLVLPLPRWISTVVSYDGRWSGEMHSRRQALGSAPRLGAASAGGRPGFSAGQWLSFEALDTHEHHGAVLSVHLAWSGDHEWNLDTNVDGDSVLWLGARLEPGEIELQPGQNHAAPPVLLAFGCAGRAAVRRALHRHIRDAVLPSAARRPRKVHLNTWEACGFAQSMPRLEQLARDAAALGVERFVLDDGWFAARRDDTSSLGDWWPSPAIFPQGLEPLIRHVHGLGMDFGLWIEPEMVSPDSQLYRRHPEWCLQREGVPRATQRGQLVLDLTQPPVAGQVFVMLDALLREYPIAYLKWDHNRELFPLAGRGVAQTQALYGLLDRLRAAHPAVEIETCASGGGRVDLAMLARCTRFWASDNNDPLERLRINRSWLQFLPLGACGNHVGPSPNPITGRALSMDLRAKVAMFGHMGVEADPAAMDETDRGVLAAHIALYKDWREVLHRGDLSEISSSDPAISGWLAVHGERAIALVVQTDFPRFFESAPLRFAGLDPARRYRVRLPEPWPAIAARQLAEPERWRAGVVLSGRALVERGLRLPLRQAEVAWLVTLEALE